MCGVFFSSCKAILKLIIRFDHYILARQEERHTSHAGQIITIGGQLPKFNHFYLVRRRIRPMHNIEKCSFIFRKYHSASQLTLNTSSPTLSVVRLSSSSGIT